MDWYHLIENLGKVGGSQQHLDAVETCLWQGDVDSATEQFKDMSRTPAIGEILTRSLIQYRVELRADENSSNSE